MFFWIRKHLLSLSSLTITLSLFYFFTLSITNRTIFIFIISSSSISMAGHPSSSEIQIRVNSRRGYNAVHPVEIDATTPQQPSSAAPSTVVSREVKHFKKWVPWLIPVFVVANTILFVITMYVNNCPENSDSCIAKFLGRFSFQPFKENPLLGPSSTSWVSLSLSLFFSFLRNFCFFLWFLC